MCRLGFVRSIELARSGTPPRAQTLSSVRVSSHSSPGRRLRRQLHSPVEGRTTMCYFRGENSASSCANLGDRRNSLQGCILFDVRSPKGTTCSCPEDSSAQELVARVRWSASHTQGRTERKCGWRCRAIAPTEVPDARLRRHRVWPRVACLGVASHKAATVVGVAILGIEIDGQLKIAFCQFGRVAQEISPAAIRLHG